MFGQVKKWVALTAVLLFTTSINGGTSNKTVKNLLSLSPADSKAFLNSFDTIVSDCDGVLWNIHRIPGVNEVIDRLKTMGKKIHFLSNNSGKSKEETKSDFNSIGIDLDPVDLIYPSMAIIKFLKSHNFTKKAYIVGMPNFVQQFHDAGISYITEDNFYTTDVEEFINNVTRQQHEIGAVVMDMSINLNYYAIAKVLYLLRNPEIMYLVSAEDKVYKRVDDFNLPDLGYFSKIITNISGRSPTVFGKPSESLKEIVFKQFNITDPQRTLFIGDMLEQDMGFASVCGFRKLFVLSGGNSLKDVAESINPANIPDYYIESLGHLKSILV